MITDGLLLDLNTVSSIDFENQWWDQTSNDNLEVDGKQFYAVSDYVIPDMYVVLFNKGMIDANNLENPYDLVHEGTWTIDKMLELSSAVLLDNGDDIWDVNDTYGFGASGDHMLTAFSYASGLTLVTKDEDGFFAFNFNNQKVYDLVDKLQRLFESPSTYHYSWQQTSALTVTPPRNPLILVQDVHSSRSKLSPASANSATPILSSVFFPILSLTKIRTNTIPSTGADLPAFRW